jgi:hypothetical protein
MEPTGKLRIDQRVLTNPREDCLYPGSLKRPRTPPAVPACDLGGVVFAGVRFKLHDVAQRQAGGDAVGDGVGRAEGVAFVLGILSQDFGRSYLLGRFS